jgi:flagellar motor switch protein FliM
MPDNPPGAGSEVLSQSEAGTRLSPGAQDQVAAAALPPGPAASAGGLPAGAAIEPKRYDFRGPCLLSASELRRARLQHDEFVRSLSTRLSIHLRLEFNAQVTLLETQSHPKFVASLPSPCHFTLFRLEPLHGLGVMSLPLPLSFCLLDRLLGGLANPGKIERDPSDLEIALLDLVAHLVLKEWCQAVCPVTEMHPHLLGHETNPRFLPVAPRDTQVLSLALEVRFAEVTEVMRLAFPFAMVERLFRLPDLAAHLRKAEPSTEPAGAVEWRRGFEEVPVLVSAGWRGLRVTAQQLAHLQVGDVLPLEPQEFEHVEVRLARVCKFVGRLGAANNARAVELIEPVGAPESVLA